MLRFINVAASFEASFSHPHYLQISGLYYKPMTLVNDDSRVVNKLEASLTDDARVIIYDCHMFIVQATDGGRFKKQCVDLKDKTSRI